MRKEAEERHKNSFSEDIQRKSQNQNLDANFAVLTAPLGNVISF